ncbi:MAG: hypothetical protein ACO2O4_03215, partial [Minisyncoccia bacterium]
MDLNKIRQYMRGIALNAFRMIKFLYDFISSDKDTIRLDVYEVKETNNINNPQRDIEVGDLTILNVPTLRGLSNRVTNLLGYLNKISFIDLDKWKNEIIWSASGYSLTYDSPNPNNNQLWENVNNLFKITTIRNIGQPIKIHEASYSLNDKDNIKFSHYIYNSSSGNLLHTNSYAFKIDSVKISALSRRIISYDSPDKRVRLRPPLDAYNYLFYLESVSFLKSNNLKTAFLNLPINLNYHYLNSHILIDKEFDITSFLKDIGGIGINQTNSLPLNSKNKIGSVFFYEIPVFGILNTISGYTPLKVIPFILLGNDYYVDIITSIYQDNVNSGDVFFYGKDIKEFLKNNKEKRPKE